MLLDPDPGAGDRANVTFTMYLKDDISEASGRLDAYETMGLFSGTAVGLLSWTSADETFIQSVSLSAPDFVLGMGATVTDSGRVGQLTVDLPKVEGLFDDVMTSELDWAYADSTPWVLHANLQATEGGPPWPLGPRNHSRHAAMQCAPGVALGVSCSVV